MAKELEGISKPWQKFLARLETEYKEVEEYNWKAIHLLSFFCDKYEKIFNLKFAIGIKGAPSKCSEIFFINKIFMMLNTTNPKIVKEYIDWVFENKVRAKRIRLNSMVFFITPGLINEFLQNRKKEHTIFRSTKLQPAYIEIANELNITIETYGDLAFIQQAMDRDIKEKGIDFIKKTEIYRLLKNLEMIGLNLEKLRVLKD